MSLTFLQAKTAPENVKFGSNVGSLINRYCQAVISSGKWKGTIIEADVQIQSWSDNGEARQQITLPREFETLVGAKFNLTEGRSVGIGIQYQWFSFLPPSPTTSGWWRSAGCCLVAGQTHDQGEYSVFRDIPANARLRIRTDFEETGDFYVRGTDSDGDLIYTELAAGNVIEGTRLALSTNPATTTETFLANSRIAVVKPVTNGPVRLYSYDGTTETLLATYAPGETVPAYRRLSVPTTNYSSMRIAAKRRFVPLVADNDLVIPEDAYALNLGLEAIHQGDVHGLSAGLEYWATCYQHLNGSLREAQGNAPRTFRVFGTTSFGDVRAMQ